MQVLKNKINCKQIKILQIKPSMFETGQERVITFIVDFMVVYF